MVKTYKQLAAKRRGETGRAPRFNVSYFTRKEVKDAIQNNKYYTHVCMDLGLLQKGSKSPFNAIRNLNKLIDHYKLKHIQLGSNVKTGIEIKCQKCGEKFVY